jgi:hypothetical protein
MESIVLQTHHSGLWEYLPDAELELDDYMGCVLGTLELGGDFSPDALGRQISLFGMWDEKDCGVR